MVPFHWFPPLVFPLLVVFSSRSIVAYVYFFMTRNGTALCRDMSLLPFYKLWDPRAKIRGPKKRRNERQWRSGTLKGKGGNRVLFFVFFFWLPRLAHFLRNFIFPKTWKKNPSPFGQCKRKYIEGRVLKEINIWRKTHQRTQGWVLEGVVVFSQPIFESAHQPNWIALTFHKFPGVREGRKLAESGDIAARVFQEFLEQAPKYHQIERFSLKISSPRLRPDGSGVDQQQKTKKLSKWGFMYHASLEKQALPIWIHVEAVWSRGERYAFQWARLLSATRPEHILLTWYDQFFQLWGFEEHLFKRHGNWESPLIARVERVDRCGQTMSLKDEPWEVSQQCWAQTRYDQIWCLLELLG